MSAFPYIRVEGSPYERGRQYGEEAKLLIQKSVEVYFPVFFDRGLTEEKVLSTASQFFRDLQTYDSAIAREVEGIAHGAGVAVEVVTALNARTEILYAKEEPKGESDNVDGGCTTIGLEPFATSSGHTIIAGNWDWKAACAETGIILHMVPDSGPEYISFTEAGMLARGGLNSAGIGVVGNFISGRGESGRDGIPIPFIRRKLLGSKTLSAAMQSVFASPRAFSSNYLIGSARETVIALESTPREVFHVSPNDRGVLTHSNHFKSKAAQIKLEDTSKRLYPDSLYRDRALERQLSPAAPHLSIDSAKAAMANHLGYPHSVCRHVSADSAPNEIVTVASLVMDLDETTLYVARGPVCQSEYVQYELGVER